MSNRTLSILVVISLSFNIAFLGMFLFHRIRGPLSPHDPRELNMPPELRDFLMQSREKFKPLRDDFEQSRRILSDALAEEEYDESRLLQLLEETLQKQDVMERAMGMHLIELRKNMTPEQAENFFKKHRPRFEKIKERVEQWKERSKRR